MDKKRKAAKIIKADPNIRSVRLSTIVCDRKKYTVKEIGNGAFKDCSKLREVYLPKVQRASGDAFDGCTALHIDNLILSPIGCQFIPTVNQIFGVRHFNNQ